MVSTPELSIIVANYNNGKYLTECISSILDQTYKNFELIISDDCSNDNSVEIIRSYESKFPFIRPIYNKINQGISRNRHSAIEYSTGEYITTLDSDDIYFNNKKIENEMNLINYYKDKYNKDICAFSNTVLLDENLEFIKIRGSNETIKQGKILNEIIARECDIPRDFILSKEAYYKVGGYDSDYNLFEDWDLKIRLSNMYEFHFTNDTGTGYRLHDKGLSSANALRKLGNLNKIFKKNFHLVNNNDKDKVLIKFNNFITMFINKNINTRSLNYIVLEKLRLFLILNLRKLIYLKYRLNS